MSDRRPLHVLLPSDVFPPVSGGAGWSAHALARALEDRGHRVTAIVPRAVSLSTPLGERHPLALDAVPSNVLGIPTVDVPYYAPRLPIITNIYRHELLWPTLRNVILREALRNGAGRERTVIHAQHVQTVPGAVLAGRELGIPVVATVRDHWPRDYFATGLHGNRIPYARNTAASLATDLVARLGPIKGVLASVAIPYMLGHLRRRQVYLASADAIVAVSHYVARRLPPKVPPERVHVIPNMIDLPAIDRILEEPAPLPVSGPFVLFVGKLEHNKGAHLLPVAMAAARNAFTTEALPELIIAGSGSLAPHLERDFAALGISLRILPGWTAHDDVLRLMRGAEVVLFPSAWGEPLSRVPIEASAAGACIVAIGTGGTPEIVEHEVGGLLVRDAAELGRALAGLLEVPAHRQRLREGARRIVRERFSTATVAPRFEALYEQVLRGNQ